MVEVEFTEEAVPLWAADPRTRHAIAASRLIDGRAARATRRGVRICAELATIGSRFAQAAIRVTRRAALYTVRFEM